MQNAKTVILAHKRGGSRNALWLAIAAGIPCFGVVAAFGVAPDTLVEKVQFEHVVQEVTLPPVIPIDASSQAIFRREDRIQRGDTVAALLSRLEVDDPEAVGFLRSSKDVRALTQLRPGRSVHAETDADGQMRSLTYLTPGGTLFSVQRNETGFEVTEQPAQLDTQPLMANVLADLAAGTASVLERQYLRTVERAHRLPRAQRQVRAVVRTGVVYRDRLAVKS